MKMMLSDLLRVRKIAQGKEGRVYVTFVEGSSEYQSPIQVEFERDPGLVEGHLYRSTMSLEYTLYSARQVDGHVQAARAGYKCLDAKPFVEVELAEKPVKAAAG